MSVAVWFVLALMATLVLVPACRAVAIRKRFVAEPRADRWHSRTVALFGGVAVALTVFGGSVLGGLVPHIPILLAAASLTALLGFLDDLWSLKASTKLIVQIVAASLFLSAGYGLNWVESFTLDRLLTIVWIVGITNAFNLLDNMDGLCGGIALIAGLSVLINLLPSTLPGSPMFYEARYLALLLGAVAGFLAFNLHPASIFLGDTGSLLIGISLGSVTLSAAQQPGGRSDVLPIVAAPVVTLLIPILDTALVTVSRIVSGRAPSEGGKDHSSHRLVAMGLSERDAVFVLWILAAVGGAIGFVVRQVAQTWSIPLVALFLIAMVLFAVFLGRIRVYSNDEVRSHGGALTPLVVKVMHKRRVAEVVLDFALVALAYYAAYRLRFEGEDFLKNFPNFYTSLPLIISLQLLAFFTVGVYRGVWRYFGMMDAVVLGKGVLIGAVSCQLLLLYATRFFSYSRTVFVMYAVLLMLLVTLSRASFRLIGEFLHRRRDTSQRLVIYGGGEDGAMALREIRHNHNAYRILGFVEDDPEQFRTRIHGYPVIGGFDYLVAEIERSQVEAVVISGRTVPPDKLERLERLCVESSVLLLHLKVDLRPVLTVAENRKRVAVMQPRKSSADSPR
jgi:UDP-GlcNAc:undecaprenyl-phosphate/decaprenyl-phosphate GlcNAc-1-phosphate transferase